MVLTVERWPRLGYLNAWRMSCLFLYEGNNETEGFDLLILRCAPSSVVLQRARYLEFEYHEVWNKEVLLEKDAVDCLEES